MQLRRGPPGASLPVPRAPALRLVKAPTGAPRAPRGRKAWRVAAAPTAPTVGKRPGDLRPPRDLPGLLAQGDHAAASGDLRAAVRVFRQATYLDANLAIAYFQLGAALELAGDPREARRASGAAGLAMVSGDGGEDLSGLGGYTRRDLARAIAYKLTTEMHKWPQKT